MELSFEPSHLELDSHLCNFVLSPHCIGLQILIHVLKILEKFWKKFLLIWIDHLLSSNANMYLKMCQVKSHFCQCVKINPFLNDDQSASSILTFGLTFTHRHRKNMTFWIGFSYVKQHKISAFKVNFLQKQARKGFRPLSAM